MFVDPSSLGNSFSVKDSHLMVHMFVKVYLTLMITLAKGLFTFEL